MSTSATIAIKSGQSIYGMRCHYDGYYNGVGKTLLEYYADVDKVINLINLGDICSLGDSPEASWFVKKYGYLGYASKHNPLAYVKDNDKWSQIAMDIKVDPEFLFSVTCTHVCKGKQGTLDDIARQHDTSGYTHAYHRDKGEQLNMTEFRSEGLLISRCGTPYLYVFDADKGQWLTRRYGNLVPLILEHGEIEIKDIEMFGTGQISSN